MNYLIPPILYKGTCFNDITTGLLESSRELNVPLQVLNLQKGGLIDNGLENPEEYLSNSLKKIRVLASFLKDNDTVLFVDFFFPGLDLLEYYLRRTNKKVRKIALMHGGTFVEGDLYSEQKWLYLFEKAWLQVYDLVICPSEFFIQNITNKEKEKVVIQPWGIDKSITANTGQQKKYDVIFPHRIADDKGIDDLILIISKMPSIRFGITGVNYNALLKDEKTRDYIKRIEKFKNVSIIGVEPPKKHLSTLRQSRVVLSTAKQEGFGYAVLKSVQSGNIPVVPDRCCYKKLYPNIYRYSSIEEAIEKIERFLKDYPKNYFEPNTDKLSFNNIIKLL